MSRVLCDRDNNTARTRGRKRFRSDDTTPDIETEQVQDSDMNDSRDIVFSVDPLALIYKSQALIGMGRGTEAVECLDR